MNTRQTKENISTKVYPERSRRVFVGLSGGVDSAVSAALLKEQGYDVTGVFIKVWQPEWLECTWRAERRDAMRVALALGIPFVFLDLSEEYKKGVADYMIREYAEGRTPNPDVLCNREVKFGAFWKKAKEMGADYIATGHYARVAQVGIGRKSTPSFSTENASGSRSVEFRNAFSPQHPLSLLTGIDSNKDQSYFLWTLTQEDLAHTIFPIGDLEKDEVRNLAKKFGLPVAEKKDSQGICFIGEMSMKDFLSHYVDSKPGDVLNTSGEVIGRHDGALFYTLGERHGFEIITKEPEDGAYYVVAKDMKKNTITVSNNKYEIENMSPSKVSLADMNWIRKPEESEEIEAKIRYRGERLPLNIVGNLASFKHPVRGLSLGQSIVFYSGEECLGGAVMDKVL